MKKVLLSLMAASLVLTACEDEFTEKDLLEAQQSVAYTVRLVDATQDRFSESFAVEGVTVTLTQGGSTLTATTNAEGFALFPQIKLGSVNYSIVSDKYYSVEGLSNIEAGAREGQVSGGTIAMLPKEGENVVTVEGKVIVEQDRTKDGLEPVTSGTIEFNVNLWGSYYEPITATIDADGSYSVKLPATENGLEYEISAPSMKLDQIQTYDVNGDGVTDENDKISYTFTLREHLDLIIGRTEAKDLVYEIDWR